MIVSFYKIIIHFILMRKMYVLFFLILSVQGIASQYCAFCDSRVLETQVFYEGELVLALCTHKPVLPGHCLIIPKRHVERFEELSSNEIVEIHQVIKKIDQVVMEKFHTVSYLLLQKNGKEAGQTVPHVHFHYMPRKEGEHSALGFMVRMLMANLKNPIASVEMYEIVHDMHEAMQNNS